MTPTDFLVHSVSIHAHIAGMRLLPRFFFEKNRFEKRRRTLIFFGMSAAVLVFCAFMAFLLFLLQAHKSL